MLIWQIINLGKNNPNANHVKMIDFLINGIYNLFAFV